MGSGEGHTGRQMAPVGRAGTRQSCPQPSPQGPTRPTALITPTVLEPPAGSEGREAPRGGSQQPFPADAHRSNSRPPRGQPRRTGRPIARRSSRGRAPYPPAESRSLGRGGDGRRGEAAPLSHLLPPTPGGGEVSDEAAAGSGRRSLFSPRLPDALSRSLLLPPGSHRGWMLRSLLAPQPPPDSREPWSRPQPPWTALLTPPSCSPPGAARPCLPGSSSRSSYGSGRAGGSARGRRTEVSASHGSLGTSPVTSPLRPRAPPNRHPFVNLPPTYPGFSLSEIFL